LRGGHSIVKLEKFLYVHSILLKDAVAVHWAGRRWQQPGQHGVRMSTGWTRCSLRFLRRRRNCRV